MTTNVTLTRPSILLVDDAPESLQLLTQLLRAESYEVRPVLTGTQALQAAQNIPPDLILLDIIMPDIDGYEVCRQLKKNPRTKEIPVIFLTGMNQDENEAKGFELGAVDYISKPFNPDIVKARIKTHLQLKIQQDLLKHQAEELRIAYSELETFSYSVSHDLKSPLQLIRNYSDFIYKKMTSLQDEEGAEDAMIIKMACDKMYSIISELLKLSKASMESMSLEEVNLSQMAESIVSDLKKWNPDRRVEFICEPNIMAKVDFNLIQIALQNLLHNAWKYTEKETQARVEFGVEQQNNVPVFYICDNGIGFDMKDADQLFEAFKRLSNVREYEGTGIGLAIVYRIINRHAGRIWAEGKLGQGASFKFTLDTSKMMAESPWISGKGGGSHVDEQ